MSDLKSLLRLGADFVIEGIKRLMVGTARGVKNVSAESNGDTLTPGTEVRQE